MLLDMVKRVLVVSSTDKRLVTLNIIFKFCTWYVDVAVTLKACIMLKAPCFSFSKATGVASDVCVVSAAINKLLVSRNYWSQRDKYLAAAFKSGDEGVKMTLPSLLV